MHTKETVPSSLSNSPPPNPTPNVIIALNGEGLVNSFPGLFQSIQKLFWWNKECMSSYIAYSKKLNSDCNLNIIWKYHVKK